MSESKDFRDFMLWEQAAQDTIDFKKIYVDITGDVKAGLLLSQIIYWRLPRKNRSLEDTRLSIEKQGRMWLAKADADWWGEVRLSPKEARAARLIIEERGLITCQTMRFYGNPTTHISINEEAFMEAWAAMLAIPASERDAGRPEDFKAKRIKVKKPGSKPNSGNRTTRQKATEKDATDLGEDGEGTPPTPPFRYRRMTSQESRYYDKGNNGITQKVITGLPKGQKRDYPKGNNPITQKVITLTESPAKTPTEISSESPLEKKSNSINSFTGDARTNSAVDADTVAVGNTNTTPASTATGPEESAPVGAGADAPEQTAPDSVLRTDDQDGESSNVTASKKVARAGQWAILDLMAVPVAELASRPDEPISAVLKALTKHTHRPADLPAYLQSSFTLTGNLPRTLLLRLSQAELRAARTAAQTDALADFPGGFDRAVGFALDRLIGAQITKATLEGKGRTASDAAPLGRAYEVKPRAADQTQETPAEPSKFVAGTSWREKATGTVLVLEEAVIKKNRNSQGLVFRMSNASQLSRLDLQTKYEFVD